MSLAEEIHTRFKDIDIILMPIWGLMFILCSGVGALFPEMTFNGERVSYAAEPLKFVAVLLGGVAIGLICIAYGIIRFAFSRRQKNS